MKETFHVGEEVYSYLTIMGLSKDKSYMVYDVRENTEVLLIKDDNNSLYWYDKCLFTKK